MKKFIVLSIVLLMLAGFAITSSADVVTLFADQTLPVGELTVTVDIVNNNLVVTYTMDPIEGWELGDTHLYVGTLPPEKSAPGQFPYGPEVAIGGVYTIDLTDFTVPTTLYIAAQAEVRKQTGVDPVTFEPIYQEETAWAEGTQIRSGKNWAMYFTFVVPAE